LNYVDYVLVRLADPTLRVTLFDQDSLGQILTTAYDADAAPLDGPFSAVFDEFFIGVAIPRRATLDGVWGPITTPERHEGRFQLYNLGGAVGPRVDAIWRGSIVARTVPATGQVIGVQGSWPDTSGIDAAIIADLGALPTDASTLETQRRTRYLARVRAAMLQPTALTDARFDQALASLGVTTVSDLITRAAGTGFVGELQVTFSAPSNAEPSPRQLPLSVALLIRDATNFSVASLLADTKLVRDHLEDFGLDRPRDPQAIEREPVLVAWVVPSTVFDDVDWPGGENGANDVQRNALRRAAAGQWLSREGIGLVVTSPH
jgi:hypothetical protein